MKKIAMLCVVALMAACAPVPTLDTSADAVLSFDGLTPIKNARLGNAWIDPDVDFTQYNKILPGKAEFEFRAVKKSARSSSMRRSNETEFWISDESKQKLIDEVSKVFAEELAKSKNFTIVDKPGPDVLILVGAMHDIVSNVPPELVGRGEIYLSSVGEGTLIIEARDSLSGETIYRAVDRRRMDSGGAGGGIPIQANSVTTWAEVRRWARRWALRLTEGLDSIYEE